MNVTVCMAIEDKNMLNPDCLESLFNQSIVVGVYNILLVNYDSDYVANYYYNKYSKQYSNFKQVKIDDRYKGNIKNKVINDIDTEYVIFIDGETKLYKNALTEFDALSLDGENDLVIGQLDSIVHRRKANRKQARILEDEILNNIERISMYKTEVIKSNKIEFIPTSIFANKAFYIEYLSNSYGVGKVNSKIFNLDRYIRHKQVNMSVQEYFKIQEKMMISLSTGVAMNTENKIQAISQQYLNILHSDMNKQYLVNCEEQVDTKIWLREFSELTQRYLLPPCMSYISTNEQNLIRAIKENNLGEIDLYLKNQEIAKKLNRTMKKINNKVTEEVHCKQNKELAKTLENNLTLTANKLSIIEKRINEMIGR